MPSFEVAKCCVTSSPSALKNAGVVLSTSRFGLPTVPSESAEGEVKPVSVNQKSSLTSLS